MASTISAGTTSGTAIAIAGDTSGQLQLQTNGTTTAVTIDTSQNFFVNKTAYSDTSGNGFGVFPNSGVPQVSCVGASNSTNKNFTVYSSTDSAYKFYTDYAGNGYFAGNLQFNSGYGSVATAYGCRAWVSFNSAGTIRGSANVSSVTRNSTGIFTIAYTNAMPDANYSAQYTSSKSQSMIYSSSEGGSDPTTTQIQVQSSNSGGTVLNPDFGCVAIFR